MLKANNKVYFFFSHVMHMHASNLKFLFVSGKINVRLILYNFSIAIDKLYHNDL